jgi:hypothetical protein
MSPTDDWHFDDLMCGSGSIARRNERERNRVRTINQTFARLRQHLPASVTWAAAAAAAAAAASAAGGSSTPASCRGGSGPGVQHRSGGRSSATAAVPGVKSKKLSKVQILRAAIDYIAHLQRTLGTAGATSATTQAARRSDLGVSQHDRPQKNVKHEPMITTDPDVVGYEGCSKLRQNAATVDSDGVRTAMSATGATASASATARGNAILIPPGWFTIANRYLY